MTFFNSLTGKKELEEELKNLKIKEEENQKKSEKLENEIKKKVEEFKKTYEKLEMENNNLKKKLNSYTGNNPIPVESVKEYDIIIDIPSVDYFSKKDTSWNIYLSNKLKEKLEKNGCNISKPLSSLLSEFKDFSTLACLGSFNKGKTFFINKFNYSYLPSGTQSQTIGLSFSICHNNQTIAIDTAGSNTALQVGEDKSEEQLARKESTEMFLRDMSFSLANIIVYVLNELTWTDQRFILALQAKIQSLQKENIIKKLIIVHNYPKINTMEELLLEIKTYMDSPFNGIFHHGDFKGIKSKDELVLFFTESKNGTFHYFLCNDNSEFGKRYNELTIEAIRTTHKCYNDNSDFDKVLLNGLQNNMVPYCKSPEKLKISKFVDGDKLIPLQNEYSKQLFNAESKESSIFLKEISELYDSLIPHKSTITQTPTFKITPDTDSNRENDFKLIVNKVEFIGLQMVFSSGYKPMYDIVPVGKDLLFLIEVPQMDLTDITYETKYQNEKWILIVRGLKKLKYNSNDPESCYPWEKALFNHSNNQRRDGSFELPLPIPSNYYPKDPYITLEKGVLSFTFKSIE
ncbi:hypothetical protein ACTA71_001784 [Dictyostelium dimigraforme]